MLGAIIFVIITIIIMLMNGKQPQPQHIATRPRRIHIIDPTPVVEPVVEKVKIRKKVRFHNIRHERHFDKNNSADDVVGELCDLTDNDTTMLQY